MNSSDFVVKDLPLDHRLDPRMPVSIPMRQHPYYRSGLAIQAGVERNLLFKTWGGLGDQICSEPTLRFVLKNFKDCKISLAAQVPELFTHLKFDRVFDLNDISPNWDKYYVFETITPPDKSNMVWLFFSHMLTNCVDFPSMCSIRSQLPVGDKEILITPKVDMKRIAEMKINSRGVFVHPGKHWPSKTFPKDWWDEVLRLLLLEGFKPIIIGADSDTNKTTVDVDTTGCTDLRNKCSVTETIWLLQHAKTLLTNDSAPLHMAASRDPSDATSGQAWIGYIATCKHPDYITHWRQSESGALAWQWREENLSVGGSWEHINHCPNQKENLVIDNVDPDVLLSWLPKPHDVVRWVKQKMT